MATTQLFADVDTRSSDKIPLTTVTPIEYHIAKAIRSRHSTRAFKPDPIPTEILEECLSIAQHAPSNSNIQPWRVTIASGAALQRLSDSLLAAVSDPNIKPKIEPIPDEYKHYRSELGHQLYGKDGYNVPRSAKDEMTEARNRNYKFFGAPMAMILSVDNSLDHCDVLSAGLYLKALCLLLQERGIGQCIEVSVAGYPEVIRKELGISDNMRVLCGVAIGFEDDQHQINRLKSSRDEWKKVVTFVKD